MSNAITRTAFEWATLADRGLAEDERAQLDAWLAKDERHLGAYHRALAAYAFSARSGIFIEPLSDAVPARPQPELYDGETEDVPELAHARFRRHISRRAVLGMAGTAAAGVAAMAYWHGPSGAASEEHVLRTAAGEVRNVLLDDGTAIVLDTATELRVSLSGRTRDIVMLAGKAIFDVAFDPSRTLLLHAIGFTARARHASFSVESFSRTLPQLMVREGKLDLTPTAATTITLQAREQATVAPGGYVTLQRLSSAEVERELLWKQGKIAFTNTPLSEAIAAFRRYGGPLIVLDNPRLGSLEVTGMFSGNDPRGFARAVAQAFDLRVREEKDTALVLVTS